MPDTFRFLTFAQEPPVKRSETRCTCGMSSRPGDAIYSFQERLAGFSLNTCGLQERRDAWQDQAWPCGILQWAKVHAASIPTQTSTFCSCLVDVGREEVRERHAQSKDSFRGIQMGLSIRTI